MTGGAGPITSRANARVRRWRALLQDARLRRGEARAVIEGPHLVTACLDAGWPLEFLIASESALLRPEGAALVARSGQSPVILSDAVFRAMADADTPAGLAAEIRLDRPPAAPSTGCVFLDQVQDAGNVGAILRSASAFGVGMAMLGSGCAEAWSPKVLRAAMGAHFRMRIQTEVDLDAALREFKGTVACTVPRDGVSLREAPLAPGMGWLFGSEGQGVRPSLLQSIRLKVTIPMAPGTESLNVAAAAAICFYEASRASPRS